MLNSFIFGLSFSCRFSFLMHASPLGAPTGFASCVPRRCSARCTGRVGVSRVGRTSIAAVGDPGPVQNEAPVVIYEDATMLAVDKPHRLSFHSDDLERVEAGLATDPAPGLLATIRALQQAGTLQGTSYTGPLHSVHRLDKVTSGICVFAKSKETASIISKQFASRNAHKYYVALSNRKPSKKMGTVKGEMTQARRGAWKLLRPDSHKGKENETKTSSNDGKNKTKTTGFAITKFVTRGMSTSTGSFRLFILKPNTGRTHQLRVCCKSLGAPILGDMTYAGADAKNLDRTYLHAAALRFAMPSENKNYRLVEIFSKPSVGEHWVGSEFDTVWTKCGFGDIAKGGVDTWFGDSSLLRSSASELVDNVLDEDSRDV